MTPKDVKSLAVESLALQLRKKRSELMIQELEAVALRLVDQRGFKDVTVDEIVSEVHISARTFYRYFPNKEDVLQVQIDRRSRNLRAALSARPASEEPTGITSPGARRSTRNRRPRTRATLDSHHHRQPVSAELGPRWNPTEDPTSHRRVPRRSTWTTQRCPRAHNDGRRFRGRHSGRTCRLVCQRRRPRSQGIRGLLGARVRSDRSTRRADTTPSSPKAHPTSALQSIEHRWSWAIPVQDRSVRHTLHLGS